MRTIIVVTTISIVKALSTMPEMKTSFTRMSEALPFIEAPKILDGSVVGDAGFDPLHLASSQALLAFYREAEIKHSRLALLAVVGWPLSEMLDKPIADLCGLPCVLAHSVFAPSVLNGGLANISPLFWGAALGSAASFELYALSLMLRKDFVEPGDLSFDPLGFYPTERSRRKRMQLSEIKHGRTAMIAVVGFAAQEFILGTPVIEHSRYFFTPFWNW
uniref:Uncharacterized protein n=1 Tax=Aureoumbra lagunensis TaxID=44058 RepID=A0A7S3JQM9_9STRA|mmetsp:Transcript_19611/g.29794  ORF Transcript_19611/g.29794 Transcript_19611/m.29794 type:complete len:218 (+) Transcript_19611:96-749(+)